MILESQPYGSSCVMEKKDYIRHIQKQMQRYRGQKLSDGKRASTFTLINSLQNYYGDAIRKCVGDLDGMVKAVQTTSLQLDG